jgi:CBS domain containing-hemolysin-like protein
VSLGDLEDVGIRLPVSSDAFNSIGGYVFSELGRLPKRGDRIIANGYEIRVESVRENRIVAVRLHERRNGPRTPEARSADARSQRPQTES